MNWRGFSHSWGSAWERQEFDDLDARIDELAADRETLAKLPEFHRLEDALHSVGLDGLLAEIRLNPLAQSQADNCLEYVWLQSIVDRVTVIEPALSSLGGVLDQAEAEFRGSDRAHIASTPAHIRRLVAELTVAAKERHPDKATLVHHQASLKRRHMPVRKLVQASADVLLALKPCWAMSPLMVSQLLPPRAYFDVVIFDEASQVTPADASTAIFRGKQLVVAGDEHQLPPTSFFASETESDVTEDFDDPEEALTEGIRGTSGFESILDVVQSLFPGRLLRWHYRSRDERLIAFSNANIYDRQLVTFPGIGVESCITHVEVPWAHDPETNSPSAEVMRVVELMLDHARRAPSESLGVITMGIKHSTRVQEALIAALANAPDVQPFFSEERDEPYFVKNLERVQGDERDAIILTVGYGKNQRGQLLLRFGPLLIEGGERRLNVAVTRAKQRLTLVTSFSSNDLDPERLNSAGMQLLRDYVVYAESGGTDLGSAARVPVLNPFEVDVRDCLAAKGMKLIPQYGSSGYRLDFAVQHPTEPGRFALAIECDGASFHSAPTARDRDRLRQQQLELIGWRFHRIWSTEWFRDKETAIAKAVKAYEDALVAPPTAPGESSPQKVFPAEVVSRDRGPLPISVYPGEAIINYRPAELVALMQWIRSDGILRTEDDLVLEAMQVLGYRRRGGRIDALLRAAVRGARRKGVVLAPAVAARLTEPVVAPRPATPGRLDRWVPEAAVDPRKVMPGRAVQHKSFGRGTVISVRFAAQTVSLRIRFGATERDVAFGYNTLQFAADGVN